MVISKLNFKKIAESLSRLQHYLGQLKGLARLKEQEFLKDHLYPAATESFLRRSLELIFDVGRHILAKSYGLKEIEYKKIALSLGEKGVLPGDYSITLVKMAGYRNRMVHFYHEVSDQELYNILQQDLKDIERFIVLIADFIEKVKSKD